MIELRVQCINKADRYNPHKHITHIGGINAENRRWKLEEEKAIIEIEQKRYSFFVIAEGKRVEVIVAEHEGRKYLKTTADKIIPNNLLSLPECP
jgi:hypothetical protein